MIESTIMNTAEQVHKFKALKRKELVKPHSAKSSRTGTFTLARANRIKSQPLNVSRVKILEHEIHPDN
jgi:hypothetical protein